MNHDWVIFYDDGSVVDSDSDMRDIPRLGVEVVCQRSASTGYDMLRTDGDYFVYDENRGGWRDTDMFGVWDHLNTCREPLVLFGRNMSDDDFKKLLQKVREYCGHKSAWKRREPRSL